MSGYLTQRISSKQIKSLGPKDEPKYNAMEIFHVPLGFRVTTITIKKYDDGEIIIDTNMIEEFK